MMIDPRQILFGGPPLQKGTIQLFLGLFLLLAAVLLILLTHEDYWFALLVLAGIVGCGGAFKLSAPEDKNM